MKAILISLGVVLLTVVILAAVSPVKDLTRQTRAHPQVAGLNNSVTFYWKYWAQPTYWKPIDTTSAFSLAELTPGDTNITYSVYSSATTAQSAAIFIQGGKAGGLSGTNWKSAIFLDSLKCIGPATSAVTASDSVAVGRVLWHVLKSKALAPCDMFRFLIRKDTTVTNGGGGTYGVAAHFNLNPNLPK